MKADHLTEESIDLLNRLSARLASDDPEQALQFAETAYNEAVRIGQKNGMADGLKNISFSNYLLSNYELCIQKGLEAQAFYSELDNEEKLAGVFNTLAIAYYRMGIHDESLKYNLKSLEIKEKLQLDTLAASYINLGNVYHDMHEYEKALVYYEKSLKEYQINNHKQGESVALSNMGSIYAALKKNDRALELLDESLKLKNVSDKRGIATNLHQRGDVYLKLNELTNAEKDFLKSLQFNIETGYKWGEATNLISLGNVAIKKGELDKCFEYLNKALTMCEQLNLKSGEFHVHELLAEAYKERENYEKAYYHYQKFHETKEEVIGQEKTNKLNFLKTQNLEKEKEIEQLKNVELKKANEEIDLKNKELYRLSLVASKTNNVILIFDAQGNLQWVNETFTKYIGYTLEQLISNNKTTIFDISTNPDIRNIFNTCLETQKSVTYESKHSSVHTGEVWIVNTLTPVYEEDGRLKNFIIISSDITERKKIEDVIKEKNKDITDSIYSARRIQAAILPNPEDIGNALKNSFGLLIPKDIVPGDFMWFREKNDNILIALGDCTGHGVPGAMMTVLGTSILNRINPDPEKSSPAWLLSAVDYELRKDMKKKNTTEMSAPEGMDMIICKVNKRNLQVEYAGAKRPLYHVNAGILNQIDGDKLSIGGFEEEEMKQFKNHVIAISKGDTIYLTTDGFGDQFGGPNEKKFSTKKLKEFLLSIQSLNMKEQKAALKTAFKEWKGDYEQTDDISVIGIGHL
jgi:PAS domain S-box-containing protein